MPLYEYECDACGHRFERIQKFSDPLADTCPSCGRGPVRKLLSSPAIQFKGSGWYITDYARKDSTPAAARSDDKNAKSGGGEAKDAKPAGDSGGQSKTTTEPAKTSETKSDTKGGSS